MSIIREEMQVVYDIVHASQLEAYTWYGVIKVQIETATNKNDLDKINC